MALSADVEEQLGSCKDLLQAAIDDVKRVSAGGEAALLQRLNGSVQEKLLSLTALFRNLDLEVEAADSEQESQALQAKLKLLKDEYNALRPRLRSANLMAKQHAEKEARRERELLLGGGEEATLRRRKLQTQAEMAAAAEDVTDSFRRSRQIMMQEVQRGMDTLQTMEDSNRQLKQTDDEYTKQRTVLGRTRNLLSLLQRQDVQDRIIVIVGSILFLLVCTYVLWKRLPIINRISITGWFLSKPPPRVSNISPELLHKDEASGSFPPPSGWLQPPGDPVKTQMSSTVPPVSADPPPHKKSYLSALKRELESLKPVVDTLVKLATELSLHVRVQVIWLSKWITHMIRTQMERRGSAPPEDEPRGEDLKEGQETGGDVGDDGFISGEDSAQDSKNRTAAGEESAVGSGTMNVTQAASNTTGNIPSTAGNASSITSSLPSSSVLDGTPPSNSISDLNATCHSSTEVQHGNMTAGLDHPVTSASQIDQSNNTDAQVEDTHTNTVEGNVGRIVPVPEDAGVTEKDVQEELQVQMQAEEEHVDKVRTQDGAEEGPETLNVGEINSVNSSLGEEVTELKETVLQQHMIAQSQVQGSNEKSLSEEGVSSQGLAPGHLSSSVDSRVGEENSTDTQTLNMSSNSHGFSEDPGPSPNVAHMEMDPTEKELQNLTNVRVSEEPRGNVGSASLSNSESRGEGDVDVTNGTAFYSLPSKEEMELHDSERESAAAEPEGNGEKDGGGKDEHESADIEPIAEDNKNDGRFRDRKDETVIVEDVKVVATESESEREGGEVDGGSERTDAVYDPLVTPVMGDGHDEL